MDSRLALSDPDNRVFYCPHCKRPVSAHKEALTDDYLFTSRGAEAGFGFKLPSLIDDTIGGVSALGFGAITAYYGFPSALGAIERRLPRWRGTVIPPLIAAVPAGLGVAFTAAVGRTLVPGLVELGLQVFFGTSGAIFGATVDAKRHLAASQLRRASPSPPSSST